MIATIKQNKMGQPPNFFWEGGRGEGTPPTPPSENLSRKRANCQKIQAIYFREKLSERLTAGWIRLHSVSL